jgi:hypothetical protein
MTEGYPREGSKCHLRNDAAVMVKGCPHERRPTIRFRSGPSALALVARRIVSSGLPFPDGGVGWPLRRAQPPRRATLSLEGSSTAGQKLAA